MKIYTYQILTTSGDGLHVLKHSETISAVDRTEAIEIAKEFTRTKYSSVDANLVRLLEELGDDSRVRWSSQKDAV